MHPGQKSDNRLARVFDEFSESLSTHPPRRNDQPRNRKRKITTSKIDNTKKAMAIGEISRI